jgi:aspartyl/glutamyl-tRNA(Asn/Gln) amidotransferase C subunit
MSAIVDIDTLKVTADLAHLHLSDEELAAAYPSFEQMVEFFGQMQGADLSAVQNADLRQTQGAEFFRQDAAGQGAGGETVTAGMLGNAAERDGRFIVIPNVL